MNLITSHVGFIIAGGEAPGGRALADPLRGSVEFRAPGRGLADRGTAGTRQRVSAEFRRHYRDGQFLAGLLDHPHH